MMLQVRRAQKPTELRHGTMARGAPARRIGAVDVIATALKPSRNTARCRQRRVTRMLRFRSDFPFVAKLQYFNCAQDLCLATNPYRGPGGPTKRVAQQYINTMPWWAIPIVRDTYKREILC
jgi:hypothetical protein